MVQIDLNSSALQGPAGCRDRTVFQYASDAKPDSRRSGTQKDRAVFEYNIQLNKLAAEDGRTVGDLPIKGRSTAPMVYVRDVASVRSMAIRPQTNIVSSVDGKPLGSD